MIKSNNLCYLEMMMMKKVVVSIGKNFMTNLCVKWREFIIQKFSEYWRLKWYFFFSFCKVFKTRYNTSDQNRFTLFTLKHVKNKEKNYKIFQTRKVSDHKSMEKNPSKKLICKKYDNNLVYSSIYHLNKITKHEFHSY